jgi:hypothetical protein
VIAPAAIGMVRTRQVLDHQAGAEANLVARRGRRVTRTEPRCEKLDEEQEATQQRRCG